MPVPSRKVLERMNRADIQKLCKDYGVKANLKTAELIDHLLIASKPAQPRNRSVSTRHSSRTSRTASTRGRLSSVIIHDPEPDDDNHEPSTESPENADNQDPSQQPSQPRSRKAKETQRRLGVGKPVAAGGSGARAITASNASSRTRKSKSSLVIRPTEETILEEEPLSDSPPPSNDQRPSHGNEVSRSDAKPSPTSLDDGLNEAVQAYIAQLVQPLQDKIQSLTSDVTKLHPLHLEVSELRAKLQAMQPLQLKIQAMTEELDALRRQLAAKKSSSDAPASLPNAPSVRSALPLHPGFAPSLLGKRSRDSTTSIMSGVAEEAETVDLTEDELARRVIVPSKKRPKMDDEASIEPSPNESPEPDGEDAEDDVEEIELPRTPPRNRFAPYIDPDDPPPPTNRLPAVYGVGHSENQPFSFHFPGTMPPFLEPPQSPTPVAHVSRVSSLSRKQGAHDMYAAFNFPNPAPPISPTAPKLGFVNPASLTTQTGDEGSRTAATSSAEKPAKRTMYGTELESDSRFGDFGSEGFNGGDTFWMGGRF